MGRKKIGTEVKSKGKKEREENEEEEGEGKRQQLPRPARWLEEATAPSWRRGASCGW